MKDQLQAIVLAAGKSVRFGTNRSKLLEKICGQEMVLYTTKLLQTLGLRTTIVVGYQKEPVIECIRNNSADDLQPDFAEQPQPLGTGHALICSRPHWSTDHLLVLNGDAPLTAAELITKLYQQHMAQKAAISFVVTHNWDPSLKSYGRVVTTDQLIQIIEARDYEKMLADGQITDIIDDYCVNAGIYLIERNFLEHSIQKLHRSSVTGELYITDLVKLASQQKLPVATVDAPIDEVRGINTMRELWIAEQIKRAEIINRWMENGVRFASPQNTHIDLTVTIGTGCYIGSEVQIYGLSHIGANCQIESFNVLRDVTLAEHTKIRPYCYLRAVKVDHNIKLIPPYTHWEQTINLAPANNPLENNATQFVGTKKVDYDNLQP